MRLFMLSTLLISAITTAAHAGQYCAVDNSVMFACTFNGGQKAVEVCDTNFWADGDNASYAFFKSNGQIEKEIITDKASLIATPWNGMGNSIWETVTFFSGDYGYEVWWSGERDAGSEVLGGITVTQNGDILAELNCDEGSVQQNLTSLIEAVEAAQISP